MKIYPKEYEDVFSGPSTLKKIQWHRISNDLGLTNDQYIQFYKEISRKAWLDIYDAILRMYWVNSKMTYDGIGISLKDGREKKWSRACFKEIERNYVGPDIQVLNRGIYVAKTYTYYHDFYPKFSKKNPFEEPEYFAFPYKNITPDFLFLVNQMPERLELLQIADDQNMPSGKFMDYVINYISCFNAEHGKNIYDFLNSTRIPSYVVYNNKRNRYKKKK